MSGAVWIVCFPTPFGCDFHKAASPWFDLPAYRLKGVTVMRTSLAKFCGFRCRAWRLNLSFAISSLFLSSAGWSQDATVQGSSNDVVAVVNADPITRSMLSEATVDRFGDEILENMINHQKIWLNK